MATHPSTGIIKTLRVRIKGKHASLLLAQSRDINAAINILAAGHGRLAGGILGLSA